MLSPCNMQICKRPWSLHAMSAEPMLCAGLVLQAKLFDAVRSVMLILVQGCSALQCAAAAAHRREPAR